MLELGYGCGYGCEQWTDRVEESALARSMIEDIHLRYRLPAETVNRFVESEHLRQHRTGWNDVSAEQIGPDPVEEKQGAHVGSSGAV